MNWILTRAPSEVWILLVGLPLAFWVSGMWPAFRPVPYMLASYPADVLRSFRDPTPDRRWWHPMRWLVALYDPIESDVETIGSIGDDWIGGGNWFFEALWPTGWWAAAIVGTGLGCYGAALILFVQLGLERSHWLGSLSWLVCLWIVNERMLGRPYDEAYGPPQPPHQ